MSTVNNSELAFIFNNVFPNVFKYDAKYDEMTFEAEQFDISTYPVNVRKIWYKLYPKLLNRYRKLGKVYDTKKLMNDIEHDELLPFIPMELIDANELPKRQFHKLLEEDYHFASLTERNDIKHFTFHYLVNYVSKGWNINTYLKTGKLKIKDLKQVSFSCGQDVFNHIDKAYVVQYMNKYDAIVGVRQFTDENYSTLNLCDELQQLKPELLQKLADAITQHHSGALLTDKVLLSHCDSSLFNKFDLSVYDICSFVIRNMIERVSNISNEDKKSKLKFEKEACGLIQTIIPKHPFDKTTIEDLFKEPWSCSIDTTTILRIIKNNEQLTDYLLEKNIFNDVYDKWFESMLESKKINKNNFSDMWNKYGEHIHKFWIPTLCGDWIVTYHEEPPLEIYISPNETCGRHNRNTSGLWSQYVNSRDIPKEMTSLNYYNYMISTKGKKKNPNDTMLYTFFSNTDENKIIFCKSDVELMAPARARYNIHVDYSILKPFLHEEIDTNNICSFTHLSKDDWEKVAAGNTSYDIVCFSDMKNIYRERTPLKLVLEHFTAAISLQFGVEPEEIKQ